MAAKIIIGIAILLYVAFIFATSHLLDAKEMKKRFIDGQCVVGKIFANVFYAPAWLLKGIRFVVVAVVK